MNHLRDLSAFKALSTLLAMEVLREITRHFLTEVEMIEVGWWRVLACSCVTPKEASLLFTSSKVTALSIPLM